MISNLTDSSPYTTNNKHMEKNNKHMKITKAIIVYFDKQDSDGFVIRKGAFNLNKPRETNGK